MHLLLAITLACFAQDQAPAPQPAPRQLAAQAICPIGGKTIDKAQFADYEGQRVYFCSKDCAPRFREFPDKFLYAMYSKGERPENVQTNCPVSGEKLERKQAYADILNKRVYTCCEKCAAKVQADPAKYLDVLEGRQAQVTCPVSGMPSDGKSAVVVQGQTVALCCPKCAEAVQKDPDKYFSALEQKKLYTLQANTDCPVMEEPIEDRKHFITYQGRRLYFCCQKCIPAFAKNPQKYLANG